MGFKVPIGYDKKDNIQEVIYDDGSTWCWLGEDDSGNDDGDEGGLS